LVAFEQNIGSQFTVIIAVSSQFSVSSSSP